MWPLFKIRKSFKSFKDSKVWINTNKLIINYLLSSPKLLPLFLLFSCLLFIFFHKKDIVYPAGIYLLKVNNRNTRTRCEICSKLTINTPERRQWRRSGVFIVNFEQVNAGWVAFLKKNKSGFKMLTSKSFEHLQ